MARCTKPLAIALAIIGALAAGTLGVTWLWDASAREVYAAAGSPQSAGPPVVAAYLLLAALAVGCAASVFAHEGRPRLAGSLLIGIGILPGMFEPKAFIVTFVLLLAGILIYGTEPLRASSSTR